MADDYARSISRQVVAQLAEREGFQLAHGNALDALADVLNRFIREIGAYAKDYAELQGRTDVNILDLVSSFHCPDIAPKLCSSRVYKRLHTLHSERIRIWRCRMCSQVARCMAHVDRFYRDRQFELASHSSLYQTESQLAAGRSSE
jgi:histone H3/H4